MTTNSEEIMKNADLERIAREGSVIYEKIRGQYEPASIGKFLAIEIESGNAYLADSSADAIAAARAENPEKVFYLVKVGSDTVETMAHLFPQA